MSYVGEPFEYDVFVSYARAEQETGEPDMRMWCCHVARRLRSLLAAALNTGHPGAYVQLFVDESALRSGAPLSDVLRNKVQRSALLLVLMSPLYPQKSWCLDELEWFFEQAFKDGRNQHQCTVLRIQPCDDYIWPKRLRDQRDKPVLFRDFSDCDAGLPVEFGNHDLPALKEAIRQTQIELKGKLEILRAQFSARRDYQQVSVPPVQPVIYLQARREDLPEWHATRGELEPHVIVNPDSLPELANDDALLQQQRELRLREYEECDGLALLRAGRDDIFRIEVMAAYKDRQRLLQKRRRDLPWAIIDRRGDAPSPYSNYRVPCVAATDPEWPKRLVRTMRLGDGL